MDWSDWLLAIKEVKVMDEFTVKVSLDGDQYCALIGDNLQEGTAGFGDTPGDALRALADAIDENED